MFVCVLPLLTLKANTELSNYLCFGKFRKAKSKYSNDGFWFDPQEKTYMIPKYSWSMSMNSKARLFALRYFSVSSSQKPLPPCVLHVARLRLREHNSETDKALHYL